MIACVILSKKGHINMGMILKGYRRKEETDHPASIIAVQTAIIYIAGLSVDSPQVHLLLEKMIKQAAPLVQFLHRLIHCYYQNSAHFSRYTNNLLLSIELCSSVKQTHSYQSRAHCPRRTPPP